MERSESSFHKQRQRILLFSDIHGNSKALQRLINTLKPQTKVDCILIAGDIAGTICYPLFLWSISKERRLSRPLYAKLVYGRAREKFVKFQIKTAQFVFEMLKRIKKPTILTFGNTDTPEIIEEIIRLTASVDYIDFLQTGESIALAGLHVVAIGGASAQISERGFNCPHDYEEQHYTKLINKTKRMLVKYPMEQTILLTHEAPFNTCADKLFHLERHVGSKSLRHLIETVQPLMHVCGHFHESQGTCKIGGTTIINPGALTHYEYGLCEIDLSTTRMVYPRLLSLPKPHHLRDPVDLIYRLHRRLDKAT